jgi:hypothetical protein
MSLNFKHKRGDTFYEVDFEILKNQQPIDLTTAIIRMQVRKDYGSPIVLNFTSVNDNGITITDAVDGKFTINQQIIDIRAFKYIYDIQFEINGIVSTYVSGDFLVTNDVTR